MASTSAVLLLLLCACGGGASTADEAPASLTPAGFCTTTAPLWDSNAIPNADDPDLNGAERDSAIASIAAATTGVAAGVGMSAVTQEQADTLALFARFAAAIYRNPEVMTATETPPASDLGLTQDEFDELQTEAYQTKFEAARTALVDYCG